jgi:glycosyltransferase involved in cell wall biosynthesis
MRVVLVTNSLPEDQLGGLQRYVAELATALGRKGLSVTLLTRRLSPELPATSRRNGITVERRGFVSRRHPLYVLAHPLRSWLATTRFLRGIPRNVVIHGHFPIQSSPLITMRDRPFVYTFHAPLHKELIPEHRGRYPMSPAVARGAAAAVRGLESRLARRAERTVVLSRFMRRELLSFVPQVEPRCLVIPGGLDLDKFAPGTPPGGGSGDGSGPLMFTARRFVPRTGVRELVHAMPEIRQHHPGARLAIAGSGPLASEIERLIQQLDLGRCVRLLGEVGEQELVDWYRRANLVVMPTQQLEGFGLTAAEAMACGTPVLATPVGALPEVVGPLGDEFVVPGTSSADIAAAAIPLLGEAPRLMEASRRARHLVETAYGWDAVADRHLELYEIAARRAVPRCDRG